MNREGAIKLFKIAALIYVISFLAINWDEVSWIFNYKEVGGLVSDYFNPYPSIDASTMDEYFYPNHSQDISVTKPVAEVRQLKEKDATYGYTDKQNALEIPKFSISVPIIFSATTDKSTVMSDLDRGTVFYPGSVYPGQIGQMIILGHSAPPGWPHIKHDWVFTDIEKINSG